MELTPEERQRIYEEEKVRHEAQQHIENQAATRARLQSADDIAHDRALLLKVLVGLAIAVVVFGALLHNGQHSDPVIPVSVAVSSPPIPETENVPTATSAPHTISSELKAYLTEANDAMRDIPDAMGEFGEGNTQAGNDPGLVHTDAWRVKQAGCLARMMAAAQHIAKIKNVPPQAKHLHSLYAELASEIETMAAVYGRGVEQNSASDLYVTGEHLTRIKEIALQSTKEVIALSGH